MENFFSRLAIKFKAGAELAKQSIWPHFCLRCRAEGELLCRACREAYQPGQAAAACPFCGRSGLNRTCGECRAQTFLDGVVCLTNYGDPVVREAIGLWKYHGDSEAKKILEGWLRAFSPVWTQGAGGEVISFVPLHKSKKRGRGFDQAQEISVLAAKISGRPWQVLLQRRKKTGDRAQVAREKRLVGDLDGIFSAAADLPQSVLLCDDVFTSGSTMDAAAKELKEQGVREVWGLCLARGRVEI